MKKVIGVRVFKKKFKYHHQRHHHYHHQYQHHQTRNILDIYQQSFAIISKTLQQRSFLTFLSTMYYNNKRCSDHRLFCCIFY